MRDGWKTYKLGSICEFHGGSQPPKGEWIKSPEDGYVRMLQIRDFTKSRDFDIEYVRLTDKLRLCKADDILIGRYGASVGKILTGLAGAYNVAIIKATPDESVVCKPFIRRVFETPGFQELLQKVSTQRTAQAGFSREDIADYEVSLPSLPEQQRIVDILDQEFAKIDALKANAEKSLQAAKDLFQATLKKELEPKSGWSTKPFGEVCKYHKEHGLFPSLPYVGMENIEAESGTLLGTSLGEDVQSTSFHFFPGDVLYGRLRPYLKKVIVANFEGCCSTEIFPVRSEVIIPTFLQYWFLQDDITKRINATCSGCRMPRANMNDVLSFEISFPDSHTQEVIVDKIKTMCNNAISLQNNYQKTLTLCDDLKQALFRKAFNGEL